MNKTSYKESYPNGEKCFYEAETTRFNTHNDIEIELRYHPDDHEWMVPGMVALTLTDNGNGYVFKFDDGREIDISYSEAIEMMMILKYLNEDSGTVTLTPTFTKVDQINNDEDDSPSTVSQTVTDSQPLFGD